MTHEELLIIAEAENNIFEVLKRHLGTNEMNTQQQAYLVNAMDNLIQLMNCSQ